MDLGKTDVMMCLDERAPHHGRHYPLSLNYQPTGTKSIKATLLARLFSAMLPIRPEGIFEYGGYSEGVTYGATARFHARVGQYEPIYESRVFPSRFMTTPRPFTGLVEFAEDYQLQERSRERYYEQQFQDAADPKVTEEELSFWRYRHSNNQQGIFFYFDGGLFRMMSGIDHIAHRFSEKQQAILRPRFNQTFRIHEISETGLSFAELFSYAVAWAGLKADFISSEELEKELKQVQVVSVEQDKVLDARGADWWQKYSSGGNFS